MCDVFLFTPIHSLLNPFLFPFLFPIFSFPATRKSCNSTAWIISSSILRLGRNCHSSRWSTVVWLLDTFSPLLIERLFTILENYINSFDSPRECCGRHFTTHLQPSTTQCFLYSSFSSSLISLSFTILVCNILTVDIVPLKFPLPTSLHYCACVQSIQTYS